MAQFYASIQGNRSERTCMGTKNSGIVGHIRGWNIGACVEIRYNETLKRDEMTVYLTSGSNGHTLSMPIGKYIEMGYGKDPIQLINTMTCDHVNASCHTCIEKKLEK